ncbi:phosphonate metabolism protein/1,5-bisphosphokinase (PRPP-forming) PhnN [Marinobacter fonticola]|uniref:phosphonate metabolism protein/1,5-bisphosphokinase (PRPP-forming) PhnN n=1 Tax=Marinobacter fonticola TaxID=2603215 RepID=UPI0011E769E7|nr:phosphonate metabolism protein/1,5-bisphosphokinase (PRPP-forming) PhnN [Marinobacter fonticola]
MFSEVNSRAGRLFYVMGASGAGKDYLLKALARSLPAYSQVHIARRFITRPAHDGSEEHVPISRAEFDCLLASGNFVLNWEAHGLCYGIEQTVCGWLERGYDVIVNGSRAHCPHAMEQFGDTLVPVLVDVPDSLLESRLYGRGRESRDEIRKRLKRHHALKQSFPAGTLALNNSGPVEETVAAFLAFIEKERRNETDVSGHG